MSEQKAIVAAARRLRAAGEPFVVATVVQVQGSSYRRPGARLIATQERRIAGSVSGGCLEGELVRTGWFRTRHGPAVVRFDSSDTDDPGAPLGCGGVVDVLLERDGLLPFETLFARRRRGALATVFSSERSDVPVGSRWAVDEGGAPIAGNGSIPSRFARELAGVVGSPRARTVSVDGMDALVEPVEPPPALFVFGAGLDAVPVVELAHRLGWDVTVWNALGRFGIRERFSAADEVLTSLDELRARIDASERSLALVMGHDLRRDAEALAMLTASKAGYIGVLGPRHRTEKLDSRLFSDPRVHAPVGLDLGAETPEEIAVSVVAEMMATLSRASAAPLATRPRIHAAS